MVNAPIRLILLYAAPYSKMKLGEKRVRQCGRVTVVMKENMKDIIMN